MLGSPDTYSPSSHPVFGTEDGSSKWQPVVVTRIFSDISKNPLPRQILYRHDLKDCGKNCPISSLAPVMSELLLYTCPNCEANCSVAPDLVCLNVVCPSCEQEFTATPPDLAFDFQPSANVPFFKSGKLEILKNHLNKLASDGELSKSGKVALTRAALMLGLKEKDFVELTKSEFLSHFNSILERASKTASKTDHDVDLFLVTFSGYYAPPR